MGRRRDKREYSNEKVPYSKEKRLPKVSTALSSRKDCAAQRPEKWIIFKFKLLTECHHYRYNILCGHIRKIANKLSLLDPKDSVRDKKTDELLDKLYRMGIITAKKSLSQCEKVTVSAFCRRRLPIVLVRLKMAQTVQLAVTYVEQGHIRVGPQTITDPAFLVSRNLEDYVSWVDSSKIKQKILKFHDKLDDFDLLV